VTVRIKNKKFEDLYETVTNKEGYYSLTVEKGKYYCIYAIKLADYGKTKLEYWAWNIPAYNDLEINPRYERMEIYGINAFEPQINPHDTYMVYFRPMSLTKAMVLQKNRNNSREDIENESIAGEDLINISPTSITKEELTVSVNDRPTQVLSINKIVEYARGSYMYGYLIQIKKPMDSPKKESDYDKISILLHSKETDEYGLGEYFVKKVK